MDNICIEIDDNVCVNKSFGKEEQPICEDEILFDGDSFIAKQLDYKDNYTLPEIKKIADYYEISTRKLRKEEIIQELVLFECDPNNAIVYLKRLQAWHWMKELKQDSKLKQFILF